MLYTKKKEKHVLLAYWLNLGEKIHTDVVFFLRNKEDSFMDDFTVLFVLKHTLMFNFFLFPLKKSIFLGKGT